MSTLYLANSPTFQSGQINRITADLYLLFASLHRVAACINPPTPDVAAHIRTVQQRSYLLSYDIAALERSAVKFLDEDFVHELSELNELLAALRMQVTPPGMADERVGSGKIMGVRDVLIELNGLVRRLVRLVEGWSAVRR